MTLNMNETLSLGTGGIQSKVQNSRTLELDDKSSMFGGQSTYNVCSTFDEKINKKNCNKNS